MPRKILYSILILLLAAGAAPGQSDSLVYSVSGMVTDARSGTALQFVNVFMSGRRYATVTNADGEFILKSDLPIQNLSFSFLGYKSVTLPAGQGYLRVRMEPAEIPLSPAVIISAEPRMLVLEAMNKIPGNYSAQDELLRCFYRETLQKRQRYIYVSEAVAKVYKTPYSRGVYRDAAALEKSRVVLSGRKRDTVSVKFLGGPTLATEEDVVKNTGILLSEQEIEYYKMEMSAPAVMDERLNYVIKLSPAAERPYPLYYGTLYIDAATLAFTRIELSLDMGDKTKATAMMLVRKPAGLHFTPKELTLIIDYRLDGERWRLNFLRTVLSFRCDWKKKLLKTNYTSVNELVVTDRLDNPLPIPKTEKFHSRDALADKAVLFTDPDFWKDYNIIEPSTSLEHAVDRLMKR